MPASHFFFDPYLSKGTMTYEENIARANVRGALTSAAATGTLWAIGLSWSNAIRGITLAIFPADERDVILGELVAAMITTFLGVAVAFTVVRSCNSCSKCTDAMTRTTVVEEERDARFLSTLPARRPRP